MNECDVGWVFFLFSFFFVITIFSSIFFKSKRREKAKNREKKNRYFGKIKTRFSGSIHTCILVVDIDTRKNNGTYWKIEQNKDGNTSNEWNYQLTSNYNEYNIWNNFVCIVVVTNFHEFIYFVKLFRCFFFRNHFQ